MRLTLHQLRALRACRLRLKKMIACDNEATDPEPIGSSIWARPHLLWIERALMEVESNQTILLKNMRRFDAECKVLARVMKDVVQGA